VPREADVAYEEEVGCPYGEGEVVVGRGRDGSSEVQVGDEFGCGRDMGFVAPGFDEGMWRGLVKVLCVCLFIVGYAQSSVWVRGDIPVRVLYVYLCVIFCVK
jgi:hypothetical protein